MKVLLLVDLQNDFLPGGSFPVKVGNEIFPAINRLLDYPFDIIIATKDWHPADHGSFAANHHKAVGEKIMLNGLEQILWPNHCIQDTHGSEFSQKWDSEIVDKIIYKGTEKSIDSYSAFFDNAMKKATGLDEFLKEIHAKELYIAGLTTDYCVKYSVLDALNLGYTVYVVTDASRAINLSPNDGDEALTEMQQEGAHLITSQDL